MQKESGSRNQEAGVGKALKPESCRLAQA